MIAALAGWNGNRAEDMRATISARLLIVRSSALPLHHNNEKKAASSGPSQPAGRMPWWCDEWRPKLVLIRLDCVPIL